jgi:hypothetical protein
MKTRVKGVCKTAFCNIYRVSPSHVDNLVRQVKCVITNSDKMFTEHKKAAELFLADDPDKTFQANIDIGWFSFGRIEPPRTGVGTLGVIVRTDAAGHPLSAQGELVIATPAAIRRHHAATKSKTRAVECDSEDEEESNSDNDHLRQIYQVGDKIRNANNLYGIVTKFFNGKYDVEYRYAQVDWDMTNSMLRTLPQSARNRKTSTAGTWERIIVQDEYVDRGGVGAMNVLQGKRTRGRSSRSALRHS